MLEQPNLLILLVASILAGAIVPSLVCGFLYRRLVRSANDENRLRISEIGQAQAQSRAEDRAEARKAEISAQKAASQRHRDIVAEMSKLKLHLKTANARDAKQESLVNSLLESATRHAGQIANFEKRIVIAQVEMSKRLDTVSAEIALIKKKTLKLESDRAMMILNEQNERFQAKSARLESELNAVKARFRMARRDLELAREIEREATDALSLSRTQLLAEQRPPRGTDDAPAGGGTED